MRIDRWLEWKRTKAFCVGLALLFAAEQAWGADPSTLQMLQLSGAQQRQAEVAWRAAILTVYDDLYGRAPTEQELKEALEFLRRSPQLAHLIERLSESPESRWRLRQLNPERIARRKREAARMSDAVSRMVGASLRDAAQGWGLGAGGNGPEPRAQSPDRIAITSDLTIEPDPTVLADLDESRIAAIETWLKDPETLCSNCAPNALAPMLGMVGIPVSRETITAQAFLVDYLSGNLELGSRVKGQGEVIKSSSLHPSPLTRMVPSPSPCPRFNGSRRATG